MGKSIPKNILGVLTPIAQLGIVPLGFYGMMFCALTYPLILKFSTHFFADTGDGLQNVWNIWWVNKAITVLHQNPWYTTYLHYPLGVSLVGQTLNPFNGLFGVFLLQALTLVETHNVIVIFSFVVGGVTAFWLSYSITHSYWGSLVGGYIFTFSQYHFMHAEGHLQLVSLEWLPLFVLFWYKLITKPGVLRAVASGVILFAVILCDYYYFFYCILAGLIIVVWRLLSSDDRLFFLRRPYRLPLGVFLLVTLATSGPLVAALLRLNSQDPLIGAHNAEVFSLDLLAPFIPGGHWRFAQLTQIYWSRLPGNINETSVYMGWSVVILLVYVCYNRRRLHWPASLIYLWYGTLLFFGVMALGPSLYIWGQRIVASVLPYAVLQELLPPLKLSGCPVRLMVMVMLSASVISAIGLSHLLQRLTPRRILIGGGLAVLLFFDFLPKAIPASHMVVPEYIYLLRALPEAGGVLDTINPPEKALYYQTVYDKPMGGGYVSRYPTSVFTEWDKKSQAIQNREYLVLLEDYGIRYIITSSDWPDTSGGGRLLTLYNKNNIRLSLLEKDH